MTTSETASQSTKRGFPIKPILILLVVGGLLFALSKSGIGEQISDLGEKVAGYGLPGLIAFVALYVVASIIFLPASVLTLAAGGAWGVVTGTIIVSIASTLAAACSFLVGRHLARDWVREKTRNMPVFKAIESAVDEEGWKMVGLTRLTPVFPFTLLNYAYGITAVKFWPYVIASWIGMLPGTILYVYLGKIAKDAVAGTESTTAGWVLKMVALLATIAVTVMITKSAKKALDGRLDAPEEADEEGGSAEAS